VLVCDQRSHFQSSGNLVELNQTVFEDFVSVFELDSTWLHLPNWFSWKHPQKFDLSNKYKDWSDQAILRDFIRESKRWRRVAVGHVQRKDLHVLLHLYWTNLCCNQIERSQRWIPIPTQEQTAKQFWKLLQTNLPCCDLSVYSKSELNRIKH